MLGKWEQTKYRHSKKNECEKKKKKKKKKYMNKTSKAKQMNE